MNEFVVVGGLSAFISIAAITLLGGLGGLLLYLADDAMGEQREAH